MNPQTIGAKFDRLARHWASEDFNSEDGIQQHKRAISFTKSRGAAIDIGCGSSGRIIELLHRSGFQPEGLDISVEMLALARARHPEVTFYQADICEWRLPKQYLFISAWDSIWHVPLAQQPGVITKLCAGLASSGVLIFTAGGFATPAEATNLFLNVPLYHATVGVPKLLQLLDESGCVCRHLEYDQRPDPHVYIIAQKL